MKKVFLGILTLVVVLTSCTKKYTTIYTTGCLGYRSSDATESNWPAIDEYMAKTVLSYNETVSYESTSITENDAKAKKFIEEQFAKVDKNEVCEKIKGNDYYIYGIAKGRTNNGLTVIKAYKFDSNGCEEFKDN